MGIIIDREWKPHWKTKNALVKKGYSNQQYIDVGNEFLKRYEGEELKDPGTTFTAMFDKMHPHNAPKPDRSEDKAQAEARKQAFKSKSKDSKERIINIKDNVQYQVGEAQLRKNLAMIADNWGWTKEQCDKWLERELDKDSKRKAR